jgi:hypothetical protein
MIVIMALAYLDGQLLHLHGLTKILGFPEKASSNKHSSLFVSSSSDEEESFVTMTKSVNVIKLIFFVTEAPDE